MPFREAHEITGKIVSHCISHRMYLGNLDVETLRTFSKLFGPDMLDFIYPQKSVEQKKSAGSTSPHDVKRQIIHWTRVLRGR